ncbi:MAG: adenylate kinase [Halanaerobiales bacterium]
MNLTLLGLPGAGKGTQARKISQDYNIPHIATGDIFRILIERGTPLGKRAEEYINLGKLVPDEDAIKIVKDEFSRIDMDKGFVLDGFPRTLYQAQVLTQILDGMNTALDMAFYIQVDPDELVGRVAGRRVCLKCGATYHIKYNPPKEEGTCDICRDELIQRNDDKPDTVRKRIRIHKREVDELVLYYKDLGILREVTGESIEEIYSNIKAVIEVEL